MNTKQEVLQNCTVEGNLVKLPGVQLERKLYLDVAKALELIGGKWKGGKVGAFVFPHDPAELLEQIANGDNRNLKKEYQFFETPAELADELAELLQIPRVINFSNQTAMKFRILEPSAGQGALVKALLRIESYRQIDCCELMPTNQTFLSKINEVNLIGDDFLKLGDEYNNYYDRIIANPPFSNNQDIDHVKKMYECLKPGGRMVTITSKHWELSCNRKETDFRDWLEEVDAEVYEIENGSFKSSGTMVGGYIVIIEK